MVSRLLISTLFTELTLEETTSDFAKLAPTFCDIDARATKMSEAASFHGGVAEAILMQSAHLTRN